MHIVKLCSTDFGLDYLPWHAAQLWIVFAVDSDFGGEVFYNGYIYMNLITSYFPSFFHMHALTIFFFWSDGLIKKPIFGCIENYALGIKNKKKSFSKHKMCKKRKNSEIVNCF